MSARDTRLPNSLDDLLTAGRDQFDEMLVHQLSGGRGGGAAAADRVPSEGREEPQAEQRRDDASSEPSPLSLPADAPPSSPTIAKPIAPTQVDIVSVNRLETAFANLRREIEAGVSRAALSPELARPDGCSAMIMDGRGRLLSGNRGSFLAHMVEAQRLSFEPGDVVLVSDPYGSAGASGRANSWLLVCPVFLGADQIGAISIHAEMPEVGGATAGSAPTDAASVFAEGMRIPPVKIATAKALNQAVLDLILVNSRAPDRIRADLVALIHACRAGADGLIGLFNRFGASQYHGSAAAMLARTKDAMRALIVDTIPQEPQSFEDVIDDDGCGGDPLRLRLSVWREGDHAYFDWTGTSAQAAGPVNFYLHVGLAKAFVGRCLTQALGPDLACNDGFYDLIHVTLPKGSALNPEFPAPVGRLGPTMERHLEVLGAAIGRHMPNRLRAAGGENLPTFAFSAEGFRVVDAIAQGIGATPDRDGADDWAEPRRASAEGLEADYPIIIESHRTLPGTGGAGRLRGGNGTEKVYAITVPGHVSLHDDRHASQPWGVNGGRPGASSQKWIEQAEGGREVLPSKIEGLPVQPGDRIIFRTAGGGGVGNPMMRDAAAVQADVTRGLLTIEDAASQYGVVIDPASFQVDQGATEARRAGETREQQHPKLFDRGDQA